MSQVQLDQKLSTVVSERQPILKISNLQVYFPARKGGSNRGSSSVIKAVDDVSFEVHNSEVLSLVGESGSGKTTIARCIAALTKPTGGSMVWDDKEVASLHGQELKNYRRDVQIIYQDPFESLYSRYDVYTTIATPLIHLVGIKQKEKLKEMVSDLLIAVGLKPLEHMYRFPHQLSGGQRQRVNIARALAPSPRLLVADEPITQLDASQRLNILSLLMKLKEERKLTIVLITHDLASAKLVSDRTGIMYMGKMVELGATGKILSKPHHPYTELILHASPDKEEGVVDPDEFSSGGMEESYGVNSGCNFAPRCKYATQICKSTEPNLVNKSQEHLASCHNPLNIESAS